MRCCHHILSMTLKLRVLYFNILFIFCLMHSSGFSLKDSDFLSILPSNKRDASSSMTIPISRYLLNVNKMSDKFKGSSVRYGPLLEIYRGSPAEKPKGGFSTDGCRKDDQRRSQTFKSFRNSPSTWDIVDIILWDHFNEKPSKIDSAESWIRRNRRNGPCTSSKNKPSNSTGSEEVESPGKYLGKLILSNLLLTLSGENDSCQSGKSCKKPPRNTTDTNVVDVITQIYQNHHDEVNVLPEQLGSVASLFGAMDVIPSIPFWGTGSLCRDKLPTCVMLVMMGKCSSDEDFMKKNCQKSCNMCAGDGTLAASACRNSGTNCHRRH